MHALCCIFCCQPYLEYETLPYLEYEIFCCQPYFRGKQAEKMYLKANENYNLKDDEEPGEKGTAQNT